MKNKLFKTELILVLVIVLFSASCDKKAENNDIPQTEQENVGASNAMNIAIENMITYHDSSYLAKMHSQSLMHHYDSIYHHHDSLYNHHHTKYHHGDTTHHHSGYHHTPKQHHHHDSIAKTHHHIIH